MPDAEVHIMRSTVPVQFLKHFTLDYLRKPLLTIKATEFRSTPVACYCELHGGHQGTWQEKVRVPSSRL